eukprot:4446697-Amphidinium_carterae.2
MESLAKKCDSIAVLLQETWVEIESHFREGINNCMEYTDQKNAYAARSEQPAKRRRTDEDLRSEVLQRSEASSSQGLDFRPSKGRELAWTHRQLRDYIGAARKHRCGLGHLSVQTQRTLWLAPHASFNEETPTPPPTSLTPNTILRASRALGDGGGTGLPRIFSCALSCPLKRAACSVKRRGKRKNKGFKNRGLTSPPKGCFGSFVFVYLLVPGNFWDGGGGTFFLVPSVANSTTKGC